MIKLAALLILSAFLFCACAHGRSGVSVISPDIIKVKTVYVWDADGHTDLALLRGMKAEAARGLRDKGLIVSADPAATDAYVKVTIIDAGRDADAGRSFVNARLYVVSAADSAVLYDATAEAGATGKGYDGPDYPYAAVVRELLIKFPQAGAK